MRRAHPNEREVGIEYYVSDADGTGGRLKTKPSDFRVDEIEGVDLEPLDADPGDFGHLVVRASLTGWDTYGFARRLASECRVHYEQVRWAGTKDKEAVTTQLFSIAGVEPADLPEIRNASIEPVGRMGRSLTFGDLLGNAFHVRVREATAPERHAHITRELTAFGSGSLRVPNYFGPQRFGSARAVTHRVGLAILSEDWEGAVMRYLGGPTDREPPDTQSARRYVEEHRDWAGALERFPSRLDHECRILQRLHGTDDPGPAAYRDALGALPETLRQLFVHAAQSYLFNRIVSERLRRGLPVTEAVVGDVVCFATETDALGAIPAPDRRQRVTADRVETVNRHVRAGRAFVTAPLVGTETELGTDEPGAIEREVLAETGIERAAFDLPQPYASSGTRRAILVRTELDVSEDPLWFTFSLPSGAYATVVMREYLKGSPSALA